MGIRPQNHTIELLGLRRAVEKVKQQIERHSEHLTTDMKRMKEIKKEPLVLEAPHFSLLKRYPDLLQVRLETSLRVRVLHDE